MSLQRVTIEGNYLSAGGRRFIPVGPHWVPAKAALQWAQAWEPADIERDFEKIRELGCNVVRLDLFWAWFEPRPGDYSEAAFSQFDHLIEIAHRLGIWLHPTLFIGGEVGEAFWDVPWRQGRHPHADPEMLRLQSDHAREFARRFRGEPAILAWDLTDEPPFWIAWGKTTDAMAVNWTRLLSWPMRREDPDCLVCVGTSMEDIGRGPFRPDIVAPEVDFLCSHPYPIYALGHFPDPMLSERGSYCAAFQTVLSRGAGKPLMIHEFGASSAQYDPERVAMYDRVAMYSALANGAMGFLPWCYTDAAPDTFNRVPYLRAPHETQFGVTTWDREDRPAGRELRDFAGVTARLDLEGVEPATGEAAIIVPWEWAKPHGDMSRLGLEGSGAIPYTSVQECHAGEDDGGDNAWLIGSLLSSLILARRAGLKVDMPREYGDWESRAIVFLPSPLTSTERNIVHVHTDFWKRAEAWVREGGSLWASLCADAAIPEMGGLFGARLSDHAPATEVTLTMTGDFGRIKAGETFSFHGDGTPRHWPATLSVGDGKVIAVDQEGRPAIVVRSLGKGRTLVCAYPLESYLAATPAVFEAEERTHRLYQAFADWAGVRPLFRTDRPSVEIAALKGRGRGYAVLSNHGGRDEAVLIESSLALKSLSVVGPDRIAEPVREGGVWRTKIGARDGAVLEWKL
jgi:endo-1,4-beta-mannosidase